MGEILVGHPAFMFSFLPVAERDRWEMRESVKLSREIFAQAAFDECRDAELAPGPGVQSDAEIDAFVREDCEASNYFGQTVIKLKLPLYKQHEILKSKAL